MVNEEEVRAEILDTARGLIQQFGLQKVTMQDIAKATGKGKSSLYYYFKSKDEILDAVVEEEMLEVFIRCRDAVDRETDFGAKLKTYIITKIKVLEEKLARYRFLIETDAHYFDFSSYFKKMRFLYDDKEVVLIKSIFKRGIESGAIRPTMVEEENIQLLAEIFLTAARGLEMEIFIQKEFKNMKAKTDLMLTVLLHGLQ